MWDEHTRAYIQEVIAGAQKEAEKIVQKELKEKNIFPWFKKSSQIFSSYHTMHSRDSAFGVLSNIVDTSKLNIPFEGDPTIKFNVNPEKVLWPLNPRVLNKEHGSYNSKLGKREEKVARTALTSWGTINTDYAYILDTDSRPSKTKDLFLIQAMGYANGKPILFQPMSDEDITKMVDKEVDDAQQLALKENKGHKKAQKLASSRDDKIQKYIDYRDKLISLIKKDTTVEFKKYEEIEVPKTFEEKVESDTVQATLSPADKRALENRVVLYTQYEATEAYGSYEFKMTKREPKIKDLNDVGRDVIYGVQKDDNLLQMIALLHKNKNMTYQTSYFPSSEDKIKEGPPHKYPFLARFSKRNLKYIKDNPKFIKAEDMVWTKDQKTYHVGDYFIPYFTGELLFKRLTKLKFFSNFKDFNEELTEAYDKLQDYVGKHYLSMNSTALEHHSFFKEFKEEAEKVIQLQLEIRKLNPEDENFKEVKENLVKNYFPDAPKTVESFKGVDEGIIDILEELENYAEPIKTLFNEINLLTNKNNQIPDEVSRLLSGVIENENLDSYNLTENSIQHIQNII